ncbi:MAG TPA: AraC family transcriptional regulator [Bacilli bacterium]
MKPLMFNYNLFIKDPQLLPIYVERKVHDMNDLPPLHQHDFYELVYIVYGRAQHFFEGAYYDIYAGDILLIKQGENHTFLLNPGTTVEIINCLFLARLFEEELMSYADKTRSIQTLLDQPFLNIKDGFHHRLSLRREDASQVMQLLESMVSEQHNKRSNFPVMIRLHLLELLFFLTRCYEEWQFKDQETLVLHNERIVVVKRVQQYLEENFEQKINLATLSNYYHISPRHLNRIFKQDTGLTVMEMIHHIRVEKAKQYLANTNDRIVEISGRVGYEDTSFFMKLFTRQVGCTPAIYRKKFR